jgi:hypothetical protein
MEFCHFFQKCDRIFLLKNSENPLTTKSLLTGEGILFGFIHQLNSLDFKAIATVKHPKKVKFRFFITCYAKTPTEYPKFITNKLRNTRSKLKLLNNYLSL